MINPKELLKLIENGGYINGDPFTSLDIKIGFTDAVKNRYYHNASLYELRSIDSSLIIFSLRVNKGLIYDHLLYDSWTRLNILKKNNLVLIKAYNFHLLKIPNANRIWTAG